MGDSSCRVNINRGMTNARLLDMGKVSDHPEPQAGEVFGRRCDGAGGELIDLARMEHAFNEETGSRRVLCISHRRSVAQSRRCRIIPVPYLLWTLHGGPRSASVPACSNYSWFELLLELSIATLQGGTHVNVSVEVNGTTYSADIEPRLLLVHYLRENCGLTGTNVEGGEGWASACGAETGVIDAARKTHASAPMTQRRYGPSGDVVMERVAPNVIQTRFLRCRS